ncbi:MAG: hypothetical protein JO134_07350 [Xanthobacteraceae bacterium]|nr:hypothetical protein [Xanthobacteraceae bacterium]
MATYGQGRDQEYTNRLDNAINDFISRYNANPSQQNRRTIFLFPGGMGSQLKRASTPYTDGPPFSYSLAWLDCSIALGTAPDLQMQGDVDDQQQYVVPDGCVDFVQLRPYEDFIQWCQTSWLDLFVFGWDWRRDITQTAGFFLNTFLPKFDAAVSRHCSPHPLDDFTLIGHSFGGMVLKLMLNEPTNAYVQRMKRAITVASPFYGHGGQVHRYFKGDPDLNWTLGPFTGASQITEIVSTLAGGYVLQFLDGATYDTYQNDLSNDPQGYNLMSYPSMDATTAGLRADPYNPGPGAGGKVRYISSYKFDFGALNYAKGVYQDVAAPLTNAMAAKFYNIRGVQFKNGQAVNGTVVSQTWALVPPTFDPDTDADPLTDILGPGDDTLPAWSTRLLGLPPGHVITIKGANLEHMDLMNDSRVQTRIRALLGLPKTAAKRRRGRVKTAAASRTDLNKFLKGVRGAIEKEDSPEKRAEIIRAYLARFSPDQLQEFMGRIYLDAFKSPSQKTGRPAGKRSADTPKKPKRRTRR